MDLKVKKSIFISLFVGCIAFVISCQQADNEKASVEWPEIQNTHKPWTRWWWQGNAVTREGITHELETLRDAGFGGVEITPIYGVFGYEKNFIPFLSDEWVVMLEHTLQEAQRLGLGVDMATGTGWPFGGPWVTEDDACKYFVHETYELNSGEKLNEPIQFQQRPFVRAVGNQIYEMHGIHKVSGQETKGTINNPLLVRSKRSVSIEDLKEPVHKNENLQLLALDQVRFEKNLPLVALMGYSDAGSILDLTEKVDKNGNLNWTPAEGKWTLYAVFQGWHGKMVERAAPGGEGNVIDHFSKKALENYLARFDSAFSNANIDYLRAFFNDSYEVDDARGSADWTPELFSEFKKRRGYDLKNHLPALFGHDEKEKNERILCDYRQTISELIYDNFTTVWKSWANDKGAIVRNQAHGSPANILDLYAEVDIPEMEGNNTLRIKMASSAANVTGKELVSSESATWLNEHFLSDLEDIRGSIDLFFLSGINHVFYHGTAYSPENEKWPGWLFYAAVHVNDRNPQWNDMHRLNQYITRCQSFLQKGRTANEILLYYPIYDRFSTPGNEMIEHFDGVEEQFEGTRFLEAAKEMISKGYSFDYISDKQIFNLEFQNGNLISSGNPYKTIIIPHCHYMPIETLKKVISLAAKGAPILFYKGIPENFPGYHDLSKKQEEYDSLISLLEFKKINGSGQSELGEGRILKGYDLEEILSECQIKREKMIDSGLQFIKKSNENRPFYLIKNTSENSVNGWVTVNVDLTNAVIFNPMTDKFGRASVKSESGQTNVYLELTPEQTILIQFYEKPVDLTKYLFYDETESTPLTGPWKMIYTKGGPKFSDTLNIESLQSWSLIEKNILKEFSGTITYTFNFQKPEISPDVKTIRLDLGEVYETATVKLNGNQLGSLIGSPYRVDFTTEILEDDNTLEIEVSNLMTNRIAAMDKNGELWKKFYNINFPARLSENRDKNGQFTAINWEPFDSGLLGPVKIIQLKEKELP